MYVYLQGILGVDRKAGLGLRVVDAGTAQQALVSGGIM